MNFKSLQKPLLITMGIVLTIAFIWLRFLRIRVPRDIPFPLLVLSFFTILLSTLIYLYVIYRLIKPIKVTKLSKEFQQYFLAPFEELNSFLIQKYDVEKLFLPIYNKINNVYLFYFFTNMLPRIVTFIALIIDIVFLTKFLWVYKIIYITIIPLFTRYFVYSLTLIKDRWISILSPKIYPIDTPYVYGVHPCEWPENNTQNTEDDDILPDLMHLPLNIFINYQTNFIISEEEPPMYRIFSADTLDEEYKKEFNVEKFTSEHYDIILKRNKDEIEKILKLSVFITTYQQAYVLHKYLRDLKIIIYFVYFLCWSYFLYLIAPKVLWYTGLDSLLYTLCLMENPFSGQLMLFDIHDYDNMFL